MLNLKVVFILSCLALIAAASDISGGSSQLHGDERQAAIELLGTTLSKLASGGGPNYAVRQVYSVTGQVVSGKIYRYVVGLTNENNDKNVCRVSIWSQPWLPKGDQITVKCPGEPVVEESV